MSPDDFAKLAAGAASIAQGFAALAVAGATWWGVSRYSVAAEAETRMRRSATIEAESKTAQQLDGLLKLVESYGPNGQIVVGLASQRAALKSIVRTVRLNPDLCEAALAGLRTLRHDSSAMMVLYPDLDSAISRIEAIERES